MPPSSRPPKRPSAPNKTQGSPTRPSPAPAPERPRKSAVTNARPVPLAGPVEIRTEAAPTNAPASSTPPDVGIGVAVDPGVGGTVTARRAGGLRDMALGVDPDQVGIKAALQHLAKAVNIAFQTDYGENYLESVYQAAIVRNGQIQVVHREYFGFGDSWFSQLGMLLKSMQLTFEGPDPASPEGQKRIEEKGPSTIRGLFNLLGRKLDLISEFEDRVPAYVEQMFDRLEASGIINGWDRDDWTITTTSVGLNILITPRKEE